MEMSRFPPRAGDCGDVAEVWPMGPTSSCTHLHLAHFDIHVANGDEIVCFRGDSRRFRNMGLFRAIWAKLVEYWGDLG